ncbi:MAG: GFA family protein [Desulfarculaceae bacterium]|nr:GFA family protein [Desulfarculaceae bacterium]MCF8074179.1 GFA family protein [Desulfarculaceae bacterium]MCF8102760.1 GFA family protein [Desulfarculaceae bacterium]MCF8116385.1 GFA family protein [Desulfarculaceae bacterium]
MPVERIPKAAAKCACHGVVLEISGLDPGFTACHCDTCQFMHSGPGFGARCNDVKVVQGAELVKKYKPAAWATWHFCGKCGTRLHYKFENEAWKSQQDRYVVSVGLLYEAGVKKFKMANEVSYDEKPGYYCFAGHRPKLTTSETYVQYALDSQKP